ncbi:hypothetical protein KC222_08850 [Cedecea davisae]|uniref:Lipoprotein n=2 Tax=Cedecea davisae TaxID=158484 RepID=A0ABS6DFZ9_9ENTR|nr:hypothetical protein [Cedecea davisae]MBU4687151.1 hypothetical protein [Cedecea davisae]
MPHSGFLSIAVSGRKMAYKYAFLLLAPLLLSACSSLDHSSVDRQDRQRLDDSFNRSPWPDPYYNSRYLTPEQRQNIRDQIRSDQLEARGRRDNSTDSGDGFGQPVHF